MARTIVKKKSGEEVRSILRSASNEKPSRPSKPTRKKSVQFEERIENVKEFSIADHPASISGESLRNVEDNERRWGLKIDVIPTDLVERQFALARIDSIKLSKDYRRLIGIVAVANIAFEKTVTARYSFDHWRSWSQVSAEYKRIKLQNQPSDGFDRFQFVIDLPEQSTLLHRTMSVCARYQVEDKEFWANNGGKDYDIRFSKIEIDACGNSEGFPGQVRPIECLSRRYEFSKAPEATRLSSNSQGSEGSVEQHTSGWVPSLNSLAYKMMTKKYCNFDSNTIIDGLHL